MKQLKNIFRIILVAIVTFWAGTSQVKAQGTTPMDSIEFGLITCSPHDEVYSLYGHTAIRCHNLSTGADAIFNYGVFNFKAPHFVLRFVFGLTDYELECVPARYFWPYYQKWGSQVTEHVLDLTNDEKQRLMEALIENCKPENKTYRYNYFFDNCSTRPRNIIEDNLDGSVIYQPRPDYQRTFREMIHEHTVKHPWAAFGNDILLGIKADRQATQREQEFLPDNLRRDFELALVDRDGVTTPLVKERRVLVRPGVQMVNEGFPLSPMHCAVLLLAVSLAVFIYEHFKRQTLRWFDAVLMLLTGLAGIVLFVMIFSQHPTTSINLQILVLNPLSLVFIPSVVRRRKTRWFTVSMLCICLFFVGALWQDYAEGMEIVALCLLLRYWRHLNDK
ncbi:MAG: DUF4105 domain-containing protein [Prevotella sp.]|nr:DUF4105 domain-containing protein [Prevotella sp.]